MIRPPASHAPSEWSVCQLTKKLSTHGSAAGYAWLASQSACLKADGTASTISRRKSVCRMSSVVGIDAGQCTIELLASRRIAAGVSRPLQQSLACGPIGAIGEAATANHGITDSAARLSLVHAATSAAASAAGMQSFGKLWSHWHFHMPFISFPSSRKALVPAGGGGSERTTCTYC